MAIHEHLSTVPEAPGTPDLTDSSGLADSADLNVSTDLTDAEAREQ